MSRTRDDDLPGFEVMAKRRKSFPSETRVKRGRRFVHGDVELTEKLGRADPLPLRLGPPVFSACCLRSGRHDGAERNHYFPGVTSWNGPPEWRAVAHPV